MRNSIVFTIVQNDMVALDLWLSYYRKYFDDILVMCRSTKPEYRLTLNTLKMKYGCEFEEGKELLDPERTLQEIKDKQLIFSQDHDWMLFANVDEFLIADPDKFKDLKDLMKRTKKDWIPSEAFDVLQLKSEPRLDYSSPILNQRKYWIKNESYNKVILSKVPLNWNNGLHQIKEVDAETSKGYKNTGLYLVHLKYADITHDENRDLGPVKSSVNNFGLIDEDTLKKQLIPNKIKKFL